MAGYTMNGIIEGIEDAGTGRATLILSIQNNESVTLIISLEKVMDISKEFPGESLKAGNVVANARPKLIHKKIAIVIQ